MYRAKKIIRMYYNKNYAKQEKALAKLRYFSTNDFLSRQVRRKNTEKHVNSCIFTKKVVSLRANCNLTPICS